MMAALISILDSLPWIGMLRLFVDISLKGALICAFTGAATLLLRSSSAFRRNMIWVFAIVGLLILPVFTFMTPAWNLGILPEMDGWGKASYSTDLIKSDQDSNPGTSYNRDASAGAGSEAENLREDSGFPFYAWIPFIWLAGALIYLAWYFIAHASIRLIIKRAKSAGAAWHETMERVCDDLGVGRMIRLLESDRIKTAMTAGLINPAIVVPSDSADWPESRRKLVLSHEVAHVQRWDTLIEILTLAVSIMHWFNPLVWFSVKQLRIERERDCDNAVLRTGGKPSDYAELLMKIAADIGDPERPAWQLSTISQGSNLKDRLMSILNPKIDRKRGSRGSAFVTGMIVLALVLPLSASGLWSSRAGVKAQGGETQQEEQKGKAEESKKEKQEILTQDGLPKEGTDKKKLSKPEYDQVKSFTDKWLKISQTENSAAAKVEAVIREKGIDAGVEMYGKLRKAENSGIYFEEKEFNTLGYMFLYFDKKKEAITVFKLNVGAYPGSWNVYDSLGEAYLAAGEYDLSEKNYKISLELNPKNTNGISALEKIAKLRKTQA